MEPTDAGYRCVLDGLDGQRTVEADYVVGCDGAASAVREAIGMPTHRTPPPYRCSSATCVDAACPTSPSGSSTKGHGHVRTAGRRDGKGHRLRLLPADAAAGHPGRSRRDQGRLRAGRRPSLADGECLWASSFSDASSIVESYRSGRALLVGDSAHTHLPAGGQGMNVSLQDAVNLGWKLALVSRGRAPDTLLDTYHSERYPVGRELLLNTAAQGQVFLRGPEVDPLREVLRRLLNIREVSVLLADGVSGLDIRYDMGVPEAPSPIGERLPPDVFHVAAPTATSSRSCGTAAP
ncbi:FAD-dependent monooxygenase [Streptomyces sp. INA 01156]